MRNLPSKGLVLLGKFRTKWGVFCRCKDSEDKEWVLPQKVYERFHKHGFPYITKEDEMYEIISTNEWYESKTATTKTIIQLIELYTNRKIYDVFPSFIYLDEVEDPLANQQISSS